MKAKNNVFKKEKKSPQEKKSPRTAESTTFDETLALFRSGKNIKEIASERGMASVTIEGHIIQLFEDERLSAEDILTLTDPEHMRQIMDVLGTDFAGGTDKLKPIKDRLEEKGYEKILYFEIKVAVAIR